MALNYAHITADILDQVPAILIETADQLDFNLFAVGGCVRDAIISKASGDIDIAVEGDAVKLAQVAAEGLNRAKTEIYGRFGTALFQVDGVKIELASCRAESYSSESRKPVEVRSVPIQTDLKRRDFTINALALGLNGSSKGQLIDQFNGVADIENRIIRTPLAPAETFSDDPLRMLRAIRFASRLGFDIEEKTWQGITDSAARIEIVSQERIGDELLKIMSGPDPVRGLRAMLATGLMDIVLPEISAMAGVEQVGKHHHKDVLKHTLQVLQNVVNASEDPILRLAGLLHDVGKPLTKRFEPVVGWTFHGHEAVGAKMTYKIAKRLKLGKDKSSRLVNLVRLHMRPINLTTEGVTDSAIRRLMADTGESLDDQLILCRADITTANPNKVDRYLNNFEEIERRMEDVEARDKMRHFQSPIRGAEIMQICGVEPGPLVGALKERIEDAILEGEIANDYDEAKEFLLKVKDEVLMADPESLAEVRKQRARSRGNIDRNFKFPD
ncbi:CCA tRNA nucleotidyltransferase [Calditrichota bacterium]